MKVERRTFKFTELRFAENGEITGHAAVFEQLSTDLGGFREKIAATAFDRALGEGQDVRALFNHDPNFVIGRTKSGTLTLRNDGHGLAVSIMPPDTQWARDLQSSIKRGDIDQMSFQFRTKKDQWEKRSDGEIVRTLLDVDLYDVSPVTFPAYPDTDLQARGVCVVPEDLTAKAAELRSAEDKQDKPDSTPAEGEGKSDWEGSQERLDLLKRRVELSAK